MRIHEIALHHDDRQTIQLPVINILLGVGFNSKGSLCLWFGINPEDDQRDIEILIMSTGDDIPQLSRFLGTTADDATEYHVFSRSI